MQNAQFWSKSIKIFPQCVEETIKQGTRVKTDKRKKIAPRVHHEVKHVPNWSLYWYILGSTLSDWIGTAPIPELLTHSAVIHPSGKFPSAFPQIPYPTPKYWVISLLGGIFTTARDTLGCIKMVGGLKAMFQRKSSCRCFFLQRKANQSLWREKCNP